MSYALFVALPCAFWLSNPSGATAQHRKWTRLSSSSLSLRCRAFRFPPRRLPMAGRVMPTNVGSARSSSLSSPSFDNAAGDLSCVFMSLARKVLSLSVARNCGVALHALGRARSGWEHALVAPTTSSTFLCPVCDMPQVCAVTSEAGKRCSPVCPELLYGAHLCSRFDEIGLVSPFRCFFLTQRAKL